MTQKNSISWQAYDYEYVKKTTDWYWVLYISFLAIASIFFYFFHDWIFASLIVIILIVLTIASRKIPSFKKYEITNSCFYLNDRKKKIEFENVESYFINTDNGKILINTNNKYQPLVLIPFERNHNMEKIDIFLQKKLKKNPELKIPTIELVMSYFFGL